MRPAGPLDGATLGVLLALGLCWSLVAPLSRLAGQDGVPALFFSATQASGGFLVLLMIFALRGRGIGLKSAHLPYHAMTGLLGHAAPQLLIFVATQHLPIGVIGLVIATTPLVTLALALLLRVEAFMPARAIGLGLGFLGALLVLAPRDALPSPEMGFWFLVALLVPVMFALSNTLAVKFKPAGTTSDGNALGMLAASATLLWIAVAAAGAWYWPPGPGLSTGDLATLAYAGIAGLSFWLYFVLLDRAGAVVMSSVSFVNLGLATLYGIAFFGERPSLWVGAALILIIAGLVVMRQAGRRS